MTEPIRNHHAARRTIERRRIDALVVEHEPDDDSLCDFEINADDPVVLVEGMEGRRWFSLHEDLTAAGKYHLANEDPGWYIVEAVNVATGLRCQASFEVHWTDHDGGQRVR